MGTNKAGRRKPERGQHGNTRGKERQRRRADNRDRDPRYLAAMEETRAAQAALDAQIEREAANPVIGHAEGALLQKQLEEARDREEAVLHEIASEEAVEEQAGSEQSVFVPDGYEVVLVKKYVPFDIDSVPAKQESTLWVLGSARQMLIRGHSLAHVVETTGWGKDWFDDIPVDEEGYGLGQEAWLESLDKKAARKEGMSA